MTTVKYFCHKTPTVTVMFLDEFIINVFCLVDDFYITLLQKPLRQRGTVPKLSDSEVITMELVGEWCGLYRDTAI